MSRWLGVALSALLVLGGPFGCDDSPDGDGDGAGGVGAAGTGGAAAEAGAGGAGGDAGAGGAAGAGAEGGNGGAGGDGGSGGVVEPPPPPGRPITIDVSSVFAAGDPVRNAYTGEQAMVGDDGAVTFDNPTRGVVLVERDVEPGAEAEFSWDKATVYFIITDRFNNGDPSNDNSYGRMPDGGDEVGTWHGGDWRGITEKLDYLDDLGVNAIWISAPYEQIHGWVGGGNGDFQHYAYHGYWALDFTRPDANFGTEDELRALVREAHARGIRVVLDVVMNHPGYGNLADLAEYLPEVLQPGWEDWEGPPAAESWHSWNDLVDYESEAWSNWWGPRWIRAGFPGHNRAGMDDLRESLAFLPDFLTEDFRTVPELPVLLQRKMDTRAEFIEGYTVRRYLVKWLSDWVREYGIDGFRCDTAKHVELASWLALKEASVEALREWKTANPDQALDDRDFWMTGEVFPHGVERDEYFDEGGFDSLINFDFQDVADQIIDDADALDGLYATYAQSINSDPTFNVLSYISSHDTTLFFDETGGSLNRQYAIGTALLLTPGGVQIMYGDETGRPAGPPSSDTEQHTRSDMNWDAFDEGLLSHWQEIGQFRRDHIAVAAGAHARIASDDAYVFSRTYDRDGVTDAVVIAIPRD